MKELFDTMLRIIRNICQLRWFNDRINRVAVAIMTMINRIKREDTELNPFDAILARDESSTWRFIILSTDDNLGI